MKHCIFGDDPPMERYVIRMGPSLLHPLRRRERTEQVKQLAAEIE